MSNRQIKKLSELEINDKTSQESNSSLRQRKSIFSKDISISIQETISEEDSETEQPRTKIRKIEQNSSKLSIKKQFVKKNISEEKLETLFDSKIKTEESALIITKEIDFKKLLKPNSKLLNYIAEEEKLYKYLNRKKKIKNTTLYIVPFRNEWKNLKFTHLSMELSELSNKTLSGHYHYDNFTKEITKKFYDLCQVHEEDAILKMLSTYPTHTESLFRFGFQMRLKEDNPKLHTELIERCIYIYEKSKCNGFNFYNGTCILPYSVYENRIFHLSLFIHCLNLQEMCCYQACFEICKLLLNLDPSDPLGVLCLIDFYCIKSKKYQFLLDFYENNTKYDLSALPNMRFSYIICQHLLNNVSNEFILQTILDFPHFFIYLRDMCSVILPPRIINNSMFNLNLDMSHVSLSLMGIYFNHAHTLFKNENLLQSIYCQAFYCIDQLEKKISVAPSIKIYSKYPNSILRFSYLSNYSDKYINLEMSKINMNVMMTDPYPPKKEKNPYFHPVKLTGI